MVVGFVHPSVGRASNSSLRAIIRSANRMSASTSDAYNWSILCESDSRSQAALAAADEIRGRPGLSREIMTSRKLSVERKVRADNFLISPVVAAKPIDVGILGASPKK
jgi:hypothetical protein